MTFLFGSVPLRTGLNENLRYEILDVSYDRDRVEEVVYQWPLSNRRQRQEDTDRMQWNRSNTIGLAKVGCTWYQGQGTRMICKTTEVPCNCVLRAIFRSCYQRFRECDALGERTSAVSLEYLPGAKGLCTFSRKREEYMCDFNLVSRRALNGFEHQIFRYHFLLGADWRLCCRQLKMDRGVFFHTLYRIEEKLGRIYAELKPYPLYPLEDYFGVSYRHRSAA